MTGSRIRLLLLDFDGTLADTRRANTLAYVATLREAGYALTEEEYAAHYFGMRCDEFLTRLGVSDPAERERLRLRKIALYSGFFDTVRLNRPLWEFCCQFREQGGKVWIVSTGSRDNILNVMHYLGIGVPEERPAAACLAEEGPNAAPESGRIFGPFAFPASCESRRMLENPACAAGCGTGAVDGILTGSDVARSKPAPDCFLEAARRSGAGYFRVVF